MLVQTNDQFATVLGWIERASAIAVDTETTGLDPALGDRLTGISIATNEGHAYVPFRHHTPTAAPAGHPEQTWFPDGWNLSPSYLRRLLEALSAQSEASGTLLVFHNALFDWAILEADGWKNPGAARKVWHTDVGPLRQWDTKVVSWLLDENVSHKLKDLADAWIDPTSSAESVELKELMRKRPGYDAPTWATLTPVQAGAYGSSDAALTLALYEKQLAVIRSPGAEKVMEAVVREMRLLDVLHRMISLGIRIDEQAVGAGLASREQLVAEIEAEFEGINLNHAASVAKLVYDEWGLPSTRATKSGARSVDKQALEELLLVESEYRPRIERILEHRKASKAASTYFASLLQYKADDGRVHPWFNASAEAKFGTATGRLSCSRPNLQTIPKEEVLPDVRAVFCAEPGFELWEYDLEQAEMRVAADYANDRAMLADVETEDLHSATADRIFGRHDGLYRRMAKNLNFGFLYGVGPTTFAATAAKGGSAITVDQAREYLNQYAATYPNLRLASAEAEHVARTRGYVNLWPPGRRRLYRSPGLKYPRFFTAFNALVQGGVAEIAKSLMLQLDDYINETGSAARLVLQIHDAVVLELPIGEGPRWGYELQRILDEINPFGVRMPIAAAPWHSPNGTQPALAASST